MAGRSNVVILKVGRLRQTPTTPNLPTIPSSVSKTPRVDFWYGFFSTGVVQVSPDVKDSGFAFNSPVVKGPWTEEESKVFSMLKSDTTPTTEGTNSRKLSLRIVGQALLATFVGVLALLTALKDRSYPQQNVSKVSDKMTQPKHSDNLDGQPSDTKPRQNVDLITALLETNPSVEIAEDDFLVRTRNLDDEAFSRAFDGLVKSRVRFGSRFLFNRDLP